MTALSISRGWKIPPWISAAFIDTAESVDESSGTEMADWDVRVHICGDPAEALYVEMVLEQEAIAFRREETGTGPYGFTFVPQLGFCTLIVNKDEAERAKAIISRALRDQ